MEQSLDKCRGEVLESGIVYIRGVKMKGEDQPPDSKLLKTDSDV